jgi:hypothetical protein
MATSPAWVDRFAFLPTYLEDTKEWVWFQNYYAYTYFMGGNFGGYSYVEQRSREKVLIERI